MIVPSRSMSATRFAPADWFMSRPRAGAPRSSSDLEGTGRHWHKASGGVIITSGSPTQSLAGLASHRSVQPEFRADCLKFRRLDQARVGDGDRVQQALELARPEIQEFLQLGKMGMQVVLLPNEILQNPGMVRHVVEDARRRQAVPFELAAEVGAGHADSPDSVSDGVISNASWQSFVPQKSCQIKLLAADMAE